jgi:hypothetical protein
MRPGQEAVPRRRGVRRASRRSPPHPGAPTPTTTAADRHIAVLRNLSNRLIGVLRYCLSTRKLLDEHASPSGPISARPARRPSRVGGRRQWVSPSRRSCRQVGATIALRSGATFTFTCLISTMPLPSPAEVRHLACGDESGEIGQPAGVAPLVVVPPKDFHQPLVHLGEAAVEDARCCIADYVSRYDRLGRVPQDAGE